MVFTFEDDYSYGIIQSGLHWLWLTTKGSRLKTAHDRSYSSSSVWDTFPWPQDPGFTGPSDAAVEAVAAAGREVRRVRDDALVRIKGGLRAVYRTLELPGKNPLKDAHAALDAAVLDAYGFDPRQDLLQQLLDLNLAVAEREARGDPVVPPGVPPGYGGDRDALVTGDCIAPNG